MKRFVAQLDTRIISSQEILEMLRKENIEVEKYLKNINVYVLRSNSDIKENRLLRNVFEIEKQFTISEEE